MTSDIRSGRGGPQGAACADVTMVPVAVNQREAYLAFEKRMAEVYRDHGATQVTHYWHSGPPARQEDFHATGASPASASPGLAGVVGAGPGEAVVVTVTQWPSRAARDRGTAAATSDPRVLATLDEEPVFDGRRVIGETFEVVSRP
ncbi:DUF1428 domain-containing protein [Kytococcus sedentarius]|uniref:DUF1428 domain-containing protein n=1 Tax=Kytococcus sedentarius (strain ATCC 14392 / DSM 20547 / JCM 11482 / CCUG 33030 / NBRC 15357 / NCTC 11040 / CCM 314 / 541) TaxID=478801 RepID=C7NJF5_KYTSD|nr:DUF1428 family protein [Kytococcus sedentarius]ACV05285.1 Protein of unknown function (DUF1428) [Kytococcus sedentarius DSM 20547]QQB63739.1 DUF1428 domain-containing protein [Kytococcus sedentarius]STX13307.1 Uncharacterized conserved protein [Kytococcus sedentarius]